MVLKVDRDMDNPIFAIGSMRWHSNDEAIEYDETMTFSFNAKDVKYAYSKHDQPYQDAESVIIKFYDDSRLIVTIGFVNNKMKYVDRLIDEVFKMKMLGTKWAEENPDKYI